MKKPRYRMKALIAVGIAIGIIVLFAPPNGVRANPALWQSEWPNTDFTKTNIDFGEILSGGPPKDGIPAIDAPEFGSIADVEDFFEGTEPVASISVNGDARAYPLSILIWHEIANDVVGGVPITMTYCPLCNTVIAFDRRLNDRVFDFGTTGKLRFSDLVMYDRQTETWWQQFTGEAIVGELTGAKLKFVPSRLESFDKFKDRFPDGKVLLVPSSFSRSYGQNPYVGYDTSPKPFLFSGDGPKNIAPMAYVVAVGDQAWSLDLLKEEGRIEVEDLVITWESGLNSALDARVIAQGRDLGNVVVQRRNANGEMEDAAYELTFGFAFNAFNPGGKIHQ